MEMGREKDHDHQKHPGKPEFHQQGRAVVGFHGTGSDEVTDGAPVSKRKRGGRPAGSVSVCGQGHIPDKIVAGAIGSDVRVHPP